QSVPFSYFSSALEFFCSGLRLSPISSFDDFEVPALRSFCLISLTIPFSKVFCPASSPRLCALALSSSLPRAGDWLTTIPSPNLDLHFLWPEFITCVRRWLGVPIFAPDQDYPYCLRPSDSFGDHGVSCGGNSDRFSRHNTLKDIIFTTAQSAALSPRKEVPSLVPGSSARPADIFIPSWSLGRPVAFDVTVVSPLQQQTLSQAASERGYALVVAEERKNVVHLDKCCRIGVIFQPLAVAALGGCSHAAVSVLRTISGYQASRWGLD
uniref:Uncharacterized protein n=1 Tax=Amphimedon queenslandica TaxID=400682 RepID=A0A1X7UPQ0_AMPQE